MPSLDIMSDQSNKVPPLFVCPISLCMMEDPVTLPSGITYDRSNVEKWLQEGKSTCPVTMKVIGSNPNLIPNHALRSMILDWKSSNHIQASAGAMPSLKAIPTTSSNITSQILENIACKDDGDEDDDSDGADDENDNARCKSRLRLSSLRCVKRLVESGQIQHSSIKQEGLVAALDSFLRRHADPNPSISSNLRRNHHHHHHGDPGPMDEETLQSLELSVSILALLRLKPAELSLLSNPRAVSAIAWLLKEERASVHAAAAIEKISAGCRMGEAVMKLIASGPQDVIGSLFDLAARKKEADMEGRASEAYLRAGLGALSALQKDPWMKEPLVRAMVGKEGRIEAMVELLPGSRREEAERILSLLSALSLGSQAGRARLRAHALSVPAMVRSLLVLSDLANELAIAVLWSLICAPASVSCLQQQTPSPHHISGHGDGAAAPAAASSAANGPAAEAPSIAISPSQAASQLGASSKLLVLAQMDCTTITKRRIQDLLKELGRPPPSSPNSSASHRL